jgi:WD40 repeat protein
MPKRAKNLKKVEGHTYGVTSVLAPTENDCSGAVDYNRPAFGMPLRKNSKVEGHTSYVNCFSPDGKTLASLGSLIKPVLIVGCHSHGQRTQKFGRGYVESVSFSPDGKTRLFLEV